MKTRREVEYAEKKMRQCALYYARFHQMMNKKINQIYGKERR